VIPRLARLAVLVNPGNPGHASIVKGIERATSNYAVNVFVMQAEDAPAMDRAFAALGQRRAQAILVCVDGFFISQRERIISLALQNKLPSLFSDREDTVAGGLLSYGQSLPDFYRHAASYVDKLFKRAKPADLPVEQPTKFELVINLKTAKTLGLKIPKELLLRADEVIE
jgi:putative ABC transport system substrate-binding protein